MINLLIYVLMGNEIILITVILLPKFDLHGDQIWVITILKIMNLRIKKIIFYLTNTSRSNSIIIEVMKDKKSLFSYQRIEWKPK